MLKDKSFDQKAVVIEESPLILLLLQTFNHLRPLEKLIQRLILCSLRESKMSCRQDVLFILIKCHHTTVSDDQVILLDERHTMSSDITSFHFKSLCSCKTICVG